MKSRQNLSLKLCFVAICMNLNFIGSFIGITLKLPIYLDTTGTILVASLMNMPWAIMCAIGSSICNSMYDGYALVFMPQGVITAVAASFIFKRIKYHKLPTLFKALLVATPAAIIGAIIAAYVFGGVTSAGSSYILQFAHISLGVPLVMAAFIIQFITDYLDKFVILLFIKLVTSRISYDIKEKISKK